MELRYPNVTGRNDHEILEQLRSYLYQLVDQLQFSIGEAKGSSGNAITASTDPVAVFNTIKPLILASADIVQAYGDKIINTRLAKSIRVGFLYKDDQGEVRGIELGDTKRIDGEDTFVKLARFTDREVTFYRDGEEIYSLRPDREWISLGLSEYVQASSVDIGRNGSGCYYMECAEKGRVRIAFNCAFAYAGNPMRVNAELLPEAYRPPRSIYAVCPTDGNGVARAMVTQGGEIYIDLISSSTTPQQWIDGYIDF